MQNSSSKLNGIILFLYGLLLTKLSIQNYSLVPDELSSVKFAHVVEWFPSPSPEYYGQLFWIFLKTLITLAPSGYEGLVSKAVFASLLFISLLLTSYFTEDKTRKPYVTLLCLTSGYFLWSGKIIGPEVLSTFFVFLSLACLKLSPTFTLLFAGVAIGVKLTSLPVIFYLLVILAPYFWTNPKKLIKLWALPAGFILASPTDFLSTPLKVFSMMTGRSGSNLLENIKQYYSNEFYLETSLHTWQWDLVPDGDFQVLTFSFVTILMIGLLALAENKKCALGLAIFCLMQAIFVLSNDPSAYAWYWLTIIPVVAHSFASTPNLDLPFKVMDALPSWFQFRVATRGTFIIGLSFFLNANSIIFQLNQKLVQSNTVSTLDHDLSCIFSKIDNPTLVELPPDQILFHIGFAADRRFEELSDQKYKMYHYNIVSKFNELPNPKYLIISKNWFVRKSLALDLLSQKNHLVAQCNELMLFRFD